MNKWIEDVKYKKIRRMKSNQDINKQHEIMYPWLDSLSFVLWRAHRKSTKITGNARTRANPGSNYLEERYINPVKCRRTRKPLRCTSVLFLYPRQESYRRMRTSQGFFISINLSKNACSLPYWFLKAHTIFLIDK